MLSKVKVGDTLVMVGFTGMRLADVTVTSVTKTHIKVTKADGTDVIFDKKTGKQTNMAEGKERFANKLVLPEDAPTAKKKAEKPAPKKKAEPAPKKVTKKAAPVVEDIEEDEEDEDWDDEDEEDEDEE